MSDVIVDSKEDLNLADKFLSKMKILKGQFQKENEIFDKKGVMEFNHYAEIIAKSIEELGSLYNAIEDSNLLTRLSREKIDKIQAEHEDFQKVSKKYQINVRVAEKIGNIFFDMARENIEKERKIDIGYNKQASYMSKKELLDNMPAVAVNNRV